MQIETEAGEDGPATGLSTLNELKQFRSAGRGFWSQVTDSDWNSWPWQLKNRITTLNQLSRLMPTLTPE